ncbi:MAG: anti-sigma factor antagonist [Oscillospiraceae bacterium]|nr:anti-sigma factor antagonist [Oscillospiraceae bacterium]
MEIINSGDSLTVMLSGEIDHHALLSLRGTIDAQIEQHTPRLLALDFGGVSFMDSSGIGLILGRRRVAEGYGGKVMIKNASGYVLKLIKLAGLTPMLMKQEVNNLL